MYDLLPFPNLLAKTNEAKINEIVSYLIQFKETLEFILTNINIENLSPDLKSRLSSIDIGSQSEEEVSQITSRILTVSDVVESPLFEETVKNIYQILEEGRK